MRALNIAATGMAAQNMRVEVISHNLANMSTTAYNARRAEFSDLHEWLRANLYSLGRKHTPAETIRRVVGGPIDPEPYLAYLRGKLTALAAA